MKKSACDNERRNEGADRSVSKCLKAELARNVGFKFGEHVPIVVLLAHAGNEKFERALTAYLVRNGDFELSTRLDERGIEKIAVALAPIRTRISTYDPE